MSASNPVNDHSSNRETEAVPAEHRLYVVAPDEWSVRVKQNWVREYCYQKAPGDEHFHLLQRGEIFLQHDHEKLCLSCAYRRRLITRDRLYWQRADPDPAGP